MRFLPLLVSVKTVELRFRCRIFCVRRSETWDRCRMVLLDLVDQAALVNEFVVICRYAREHCLVVRLLRLRDVLRDRFRALRDPRAQMCRDLLLAEPARRGILRADRWY